jgi:hypothetical protein
MVLAVELEVCLYANRTSKIASCCRSPMRRSLLALVVLVSLVFVPSPASVSTDHPPIDETSVSQGFLQIERDWTVNVILVGYEPDHINETTLLSTMPRTRVHYTEEVQITYNIAYHLFYANESYTQALTSFALSNSENGTGIGTWLNETALQTQREDPITPVRVFEPRDGRAIDGIALEDWLIGHPCVTEPSLGYSFYLLNFSSLDTPSHSLEHWYDYAPSDPDTGEGQDWFRLEFDNDLNPPLEMEYAGFGGRGKIYALDPSADQWYLRWARIWWQNYISTDYDHWTKDLEDEMAEIDIQTPAGVSSLSVYLRDYIYDIVAYLLFPYQHRPAKYVYTGELRVTVVCMDVANGITIDSLRWVTDAEKQKAHLQELYPFIQWNVVVDFVDIDNDASWNYTFWRSAEVNEEGVTEVDGGEMFGYIYEVVRPYRIPTGSDLISVFGVVFIKQNMIMYYGDGVYTGLGFNGEYGGQTVIWKSWERYYRSDNVTPRDGVSGVQLHETMHAVGFAHTWQDEHYASDFSYGPMGYFAYHNGTASFDKDWVQGTYLDQMEAFTWDEFLTRQSQLGDNERSETLLAEDNALTCFSLARDAYNRMQWMRCYDLLSKARDWSRRMMYSRHDSLAPVILEWGTIPERVSAEGFIYWAKITEDTSGIENVTAYVLVDGEQLLTYPCEYASGNWSCFVETLDYAENATIWVVAWDWAMNKAEGGFVSLPYESPWSAFVVPALFAACITMPLIGVALYLKRRPRS